MTPRSLRAPLLCGLIVAGMATQAQTQTQTADSAALPVPVAFSGNGQQLNNLVGRGVALSDFNRDGTLDAFVVNESGPRSHDGRVYFGDGRGQFTDSGQRLEGATGAGQPIVHGIDGNGSQDVIVGRTVWWLRLVERFEELQDQNISEITKEKPEWCGARGRLD
jgi:hypothetical protein